MLVYPGVDLEFFDWFMIRPTGMFNLTGESQDWGVGSESLRASPVLIGARHPGLRFRKAARCL
jgi:hypothetical protein